VNRKRYKNSDIAIARFYQMPKFLFEGELANLSNDARVLYSLLKDRHEFTRDNMCSLLDFSQPTVRKAFKQLKEANLIEEA
jgi:transcription initiation factor IIE alpha subunit